MRGNEGAGGTALVESEDAGGPPRRGRRRGLRRLLVALGVLVAVVLLVAGGGLWYLTDRYAGNIDRVTGVFGDLDEEARPAPAAPAQPAGA